MKQFIKASIAVAALALSSFAQAGLISAEYKHQGGSDEVKAGSPYTASFDLTSALYGYRTGIDKIDSASLVFNFKDTGPDSTESFSIKIDNISLASSGVINIPTSGAAYGPFSVSGVNLANLSKTGMLDAVVSAGTGSFRFVSATLGANVVVGQVGQPGAVPEPMSAALIGLGLFGVAAFRRKA